MSDVNNEGYYQELDDAIFEEPKQVLDKISKPYQGASLSTVGRYAGISDLSRKAYKNAQDRLHEAERKLPENSHQALLEQCTPSQTVRCCKHCRLHFIAKKADIKRGWAKFCSKSCKAQVQHGSY
jgi:hypothetical protein